MLFERREKLNSIGDLNFMTRRLSFRHFRQTHCQNAVFKSGRRFRLVYVVDIEGATHAAETAFTANVTAFFVAFVF